MSTNQYVRKDMWAPLNNIQVKTDITLSLKLSLSYYWHINIISKYCVHLVVHKIINYKCVMCVYNG